MDCFIYENKHWKADKHTRKNKQQVRKDPFKTKDKADTQMNEKNLPVNTARLESGRQL